MPSSDLARNQQIKIARRKRLQPPIQQGSPVAESARIQEIARQQ